MRNWIIRSFRNRLLATILAVTIVPVLLCNVAMLQFQVFRSKQDQIVLTAEIQEQCIQRLTEVCGNGAEIAQRLADSTVVHSALYRNAPDSHTLYQMLSREIREIRNFCQVDVYLRDGTCAYSTEHPMPAEQMNPDWGILRAARQTADMAFCRGDHTSIAFQGCRAVRSADGAAIGYIVLTFSEDTLNELFHEICGDNADVGLIDQCGELVYNTRPASGEQGAKWLREQMLSGEMPTRNASGEVRLLMRQEPVTGFTMVVQQQILFNDRIVGTFNFISIVLSLISLTFCGIGAYILSRSMTAPIKKMDSVMGQVEQGDFSVRMETGRVDELGRLAESFNRMVEEYQANLIRSVQNQRELNAAQVRMMQAQLNPHFLYNTLDSMKWLGVTHRVPQIADIATDLATLLRAAINAEEFHTVEQELELVERYLDIQYIRFEDRFTCEIEVDEQFQHCRIPKLILQPLVENAIIHGVADQDDGYIKVTARQDGDNMILAVRDNGCGMPPEVLEQLHAGLPRAMGRHLGLYNVNQILRLHYGEGYGIQAQSAPGEGSCVQLRIPMESMGSRG